MAIVALIGSSQNETSVDLVEQWQRLGVGACLLPPADAVRILCPGDIAIGRLDVLPTLDGVERGLVVLGELAAAGIRVVNGPRALVNAHDKLRTARCLEAAGVPHVATRHVRAGELPDVELPVVVKPRFGSWGADVLRAESRDALAQALAGIATRPWFVRHGAIVQPLIPPMGRDLRVLVAGGRAVGAETRVAAPGEWRTNISLGGFHLQCSIDVVAERLAVAAADAVGGDFVGVDLMPTLDGYVVLEVNAAVEFDDGYSLDGGDVFEDVACALVLAVPEPSLT